VRTEAFRTLHGRGETPAPITVWMVNAGELAAAPSEQRRLVRAAQRLGLDRPGLSDHPELLWCRLAGMSPHISLSGHTSVVTTVAFGQLPDGPTLLASASYDQTVRLWDAATGQQVGDPLIGHTAGLTAVAFGQVPGGRTLLATGSWDQTVRLWTQPPASQSATLSPATPSR
jgi:WD40 repeat protein